MLETGNNICWMCSSLFPVQDTCYTQTSFYKEKNLKGWFLLKNLKIENHAWPVTLISYQIPPPKIVFLLILDDSFYMLSPSLSEGSFPTYIAYPPKLRSGVCKSYLPFPIFHFTFPSLALPAFSHLRLPDNTTYSLLAHSSYTMSLVFLWLSKILFLANNYCLWCMEFTK